MMKGWGSKGIQYKKNSELTLVKSSLNVTTLTKTHPCLSLNGLPEDMVLLLLSYLPIKDLVKIEMVCPWLKNLIDQNPSLYRHANFFNLWPTKKNIHHFERAANCGNIQAKIKLGICYLYADKVSEISLFGYKKDADWASLLLLSAESSNSSIDPFTWVLYRPPWGDESKSNKAKVFSAIKKSSEYNDEQNFKKSTVLFSVGQTLLLHDDPDKASKAKKWFSEASNNGCPFSSLALYKMKRSKKYTDQLQGLHHKFPSCNQVHHALSESIIRDGVDSSPPHLVKIISNYFMSSKGVDLSKIHFTNSYFTPQNRCILLNWIAEVVSMKTLRTLVFHVAVRLIDRYLSRRKCPIEMLQLVGISALLLATRYLCRDVLTVREAAWLTDSTYTYQDVVKMIGEILASVQGRIRTTTVFDYLQLIANVQKFENSVKFMSCYLCEISVFHKQLLAKPQATVAAAATILSRMILFNVPQWDEASTKCTGMTMDDLRLEVLMLYDCCFTISNADGTHDQRFPSVQDKYDEEQYLKVSKIEVPNRELICQMLDLSVETPNLCGPSKSDSFDSSKEVEETESYYFNSSGYEGDDEFENPITKDEDNQDLLMTPESQFSINKTLSSFSGNFFSPNLASIPSNRTSAPASLTKSDVSEQCILHRTLHYRNKVRKRFKLATLSKHFDINVLKSDKLARLSIDSMSPSSTGWVSLSQEIFNNS